MQESGIAAPSNTRLNGRYAIRVANTNHRSRREDFDLLVQTVVRLGDALAAEIGYEEYARRALQTAKRNLDSAPILKAAAEPAK